jgi:energy-coupling factor transport system permease protein
MLRWEELTYAGTESSAIHRLDPRVKIGILLVTGVVIVFLDNPILLAVILALGIAGMFLSRLALVKFKVACAIIALGIWGAVFSQALFYEQIPRTAILTVISPQIPVIGTLTKGIYIYQEGIIHGLKQGLRMVDMTTLGLLVCWTTDTRLLLLGLVKLRLPYGLAFMAVTSVRFIPILMQETMQVMTAAQMRGGSKFSMQVLSPVLANCLRRAGTLAVAVESRAFRAYEQRTYLEDLHCSAREKLLFIGFVAGSMAIVVCKASYLSYQYGLFYHSSLRPIYEFTRVYL